MKKPQAACYVRISKEDPGDRKVSLQQQEQDCIVAAKKAGYAIPSDLIFSDSDLSASLPPRQFATKPHQKVRQGFTALIDAIECGRVKAVYVRMLNRLFAGLMLQKQFVELCKRHGVTLRATHDPAMPASFDGSGELILDVIGAVADYRLKEIRAQNKATAAYLQRSGMKYGPVKTLGFLDGKPGEVLVDEKTKPLVQEIFRRFVGGETSGEIADWLNKEHPRDKVLAHIGKYGADGEWIPRKRMAGIWHHTTIERLLKNPSVIGMKSVGGKLEPSKQYTAIVSPTIFWDAHKIFAARKGTYKRSKYALITVRREDGSTFQRPPDNERHLLTGILVCGTHKRNLVAVKRAPDRKCFYKCYSHHEVDQITILEDLWLEFVSQPFIGVSHIHTEPIDDTTASHRVKLDEVVANIQKLLHKAKAEPSKASACADVVATLKDEKAKLERMIEVAPVASPPLMKTWEEMTFEERRSRLTAIIDRIEVFQDYCIVYWRSWRGTNPTKFPFMKRKFNDRKVRASVCLTPRILTYGEAFRVVHLGSGTSDGTGIDHVDWVGQPNSVFQPGVLHPTNFVQPKRFWYINPKHVVDCVDCKKRVVSMNPAMTEADFIRQCNRYRAKSLNDQKAPMKSRQLLDKR